MPPSQLSVSLLLGLAASADLFLRAHAFQAPRCLGTSRLVHIHARGTQKNTKALNLHSLARGNRARIFQSTPVFDLHAVLSKGDESYATFEPVLVTQGDTGSRIFCVYPPDAWPHGPDPDSWQGVRDIIIKPG